MTDYTPTTAEVRRSYVDTIDSLGGMNLGLGQFDRWLTAHDAEVRELGENDMLDRLIDRYFQGQKNAHGLSDATVSWIRVQPEYVRRYPAARLSSGSEG